MKKITNVTGFRINENEVTVHCPCCQQHHVHEAKIGEQTSTCEQPFVPIVYDITTIIEKEN